MSEYLSFYVRNKDGKDFVDIGTFSRSTLIFRAFQTSVPYEKIKEVNKSSIETAIQDLKKEKKQVKKEIVQYQYFISQITAPNENQNFYLSLIEELAEEKRSIKYYLNYLTFLDIILEQGTQLYAGKEIINPTEEDIVAGSV